MGAIHHIPLEDFQALWRGEHARWLKQLAAMKDSYERYFTRKRTSMTKPFIGRLDPPHYDCYLGDGVYATFDGFQVWLDCRANNLCIRNEAGHLGIALNDETMVKLNAYHDEARDQYEPQEKL